MISTLLSTPRFTRDDGIGNRTSASRTGTVGADAFVANALNQYTERQNRFAHASGTVANAGVAVSVHQGAYEPPLGRQGTYWAAQLPLNNENGPAKGDVAVTATIPAPNPNAADVIGTTTRTAELPKALQALSYDEDGNLTSDGLWDYGWDAENRLVSMRSTDAAKTAGLHNRELAFAYDYLSRRVEKRVTELTPGGAALSTLTTRFLYDGWNLVAEFSYSSTTLTLLRSYTWGLDMAGSLAAVGANGALLQITDHATGLSYVPTYDGNGNVAALLQASDGAGAVAASYEYSPFGELLRCEGAYARTNPFRFATKFTDEETGLSYYGYRYYSATLGRFINRDPIEESGGLNLYGFNGNDGINGTDVLGLLPNVIVEVTATVNIYRNDTRGIPEYVGSGTLSRFFVGDGLVIDGQTIVAPDDEEPGQSRAVSMSNRAGLIDQLRQQNFQEIHDHQQRIVAGRSEVIITSVQIERIRAAIHARLREENFRRYVLKSDGVVLGAEISALDYMGYWPEWLAADTAAWWETSSWMEKLDLLLLLTTRGRGKVEVPGGGFRELPPGLKESLEARWPEMMREIRNSDPIVALGDRPYIAKPGEVVDPTKISIYRGGTDMTFKPGEVRIDKATGMVKPTRGVSVNTNPEDANIIKYGGPNRILSLPPELQIIQTSSQGGTHLEIVPKQPMTPARFQELLNGIELGK